MLAMTILDIMSNNAPDLQLQVHVRGFKHARGHAIARLYRQGESVLAKTSFRRAQASIHDGRALCEFSELPAGAYALVVFHDENDNGQVDHKLGRPVEPLGFSNGFTLSLLFGLPTFEKLRFELGPTGSPAPAALEVTVR
jgi:uncharacterized protein (DUF2141 family)